MALIKVITPSVTDANITTAKVTDNAITLAKMASGTDGNIISYDASGNPVAIATGSDGQVLTSTGAGSPPAFETPASATNTPAFQAYMNGGLTIANTTHTKLEMDAEVFDTDSKYDTSNFRFTPTVAGTYWVWGKFRFDDGADIPSAIIAFYKNGSIISKSVAFQTNVTTKTLGITVTLDDNDYLEIFGYQNSGGNSTINGGSYPDQDTGTWGAYKLII